MGDFLDTIEALADAATEGPWSVDEDAEPDDAPVMDSRGGYLCASPDDGVRGGHYLRDAEFIARARTDVPLLTGKLRRVLSLCYDTDGNQLPAEAFDGMVGAILQAVYDDGPQS